MPVSLSGPPKTGSQDDMVPFFAKQFLFFLGGGAGGSSDVSIKIKS